MTIFCLLRFDAAFLLQLLVVCSVANPEIEIPTDTRMSTADVWRDGDDKDNDT